MLIIAVETKKGPRGPQVLVVILEKENLDRMRGGDPLDMQLRAYGETTMDLNRPLRDLDLIIAYEEDVGKIMEFRERGDIFGLLVWLERGRSHRPELGDAQPPTPLRRT